MSLRGALRGVCGRIVTQLSTKEKKKQQRALILQRAVLEVLESRQYLSVPTPPSSLSSNVLGPTSVSLAWVDTAGDETGFKVQESSNGGTSYAQVTTLASSVNTYTVTSLSPSTSYDFQIVAYNSSGNSSPSNVVNPTTAAAPVSPSGLSATTASPTKINLAWTNNDISGTVTSIIVQEDVSGSYLQLATLSPTATSYSATSLAAGTPYSFRIVAYNGADSTPSNVATATTTPAPTAPSGLTATVVSPSQINLAWTNNDTSGTVTSVIVQESVAGGSYLHLTTLSPTATSYDATALTANTSYSYRIVAYNGADSTPSNIASGFTSAAPTAPSGLSATVASPTQINLAWTNNDTSGTVTSILVQESVAGGGYALLATLSSTATSYNASYLTAGTSYSYRIVAYNGADSTPSNIASATTTAAPTAPSGLSATTASPTQINLAWTNNDTSGTVTSIIVQESVAGGGYAQLATLSSTATSYDATYLTAGTPYSYRIVAYNGADSTPSNIASATTAAAPTAPSSLSATVISPSQINLAWTNNDTSGTVTSIIIQESVDGGSYAQLATVSPSAHTYSALFLSANTSYSYRVVAYNGANSHRIQRRQRHHQSRADRPQ